MKSKLANVRNAINTHNDTRCTVQYVIAKYMRQEEETTKKTKLLQIATCPMTAFFFLPSLWTLKTNAIKARDRRHGITIMTLLAVDESLTNFDVFLVF